MPDEYEHLRESADEAKYAEHQSFTLVGHRNREKYSEAREGGNIHRKTHFLFRKGAGGGMVDPPGKHYTEEQDRELRKSLSSPEQEAEYTANERDRKQRQNLSNV